MWNILGHLFTNIMSHWFIYFKTRFLHFSYLNKKGDLVGFQIKKKKRTINCRQGVKSNDLTLWHGGYDYSCAYLSLKQIIFYFLKKYESYKNSS